MRNYAIHERTLTVQHAAVAEATLTVPEIGPWLGKTYAAVAAVLAGQGIEPAGPPFARYHQLGPERFHVEAGFPVRSPVAPAGEVRPSALPGGTTAVTMHTGPYDAMAPAYSAIETWLRARGAEPAGDPWETYLSDPGRQPDPATWRTEIAQPYADGSGTAAGSGRRPRR
ncbi:GyrI-like domain-containing protein [Amycolatopsis alkalitolerans]|uniref:GyrI-like domain-containing protein n=1 Tax=Amycolatopsis alkalitolerans TaxID=2547244 RepID=A0A5C4LZA4_9PSEU|nr:GyrI-like domain-containing protein [Amycolatopsis alkalitolerans]TNC24138.1 GyrI-like domain-containing protein [Amycolatopsis alkalitolerans]